MIERGKGKILGLKQIALGASEGTVVETEVEVEMVAEAEAEAEMAEAGEIERFSLLNQ